MCPKIGFPFTMTMVHFLLVPRDLWADQCILNRLLSHFYVSPRACTVKGAGLAEMSKEAGNNYLRLINAV